MTENMVKPLVYKVPGENRFVCSMFIKGRPMHGYGATMREAYFDWCVQVYGTPRPKLE
jgi:hypothetical protein